MELFTILLVASVLGLLIAALAMAVIRINRHTESRYGIRPISWGRAFLMVVPYFVLGVGCLLDSTRNNHNFSVAIGFAVLLTIGVFWWIAAKTDIPTALASVSLLIILGLALAILILLIVYLMIGCGSGNKHQTRDLERR